jgi:dihydrofolate reductase
MGKIVIDITMSLDGFIAGPNINAKQPLGKGGLRLHDWLFKAKTDKDVKVIEETVETSGAVIVGRRTYDDAINDAWGGVSPFKVPAFVITQRASVATKADSSFTFVTDGIESAIKQAKAVAGDKNVWVMGGANIIQQYIAARMFDELHIHIAPVLFGEGIKLFEHIGNEHIELVSSRVIETTGAIHIRYRVVK